MNAIDFWRQHARIVTDSNVVTNCDNLLGMVSIHTENTYGDSSDRNVGWYKTTNDNLIWMNNSEDNDDNAEYIGRAYMVFNGRRDEKLGRKTKPNGEPFDGKHLDGYIDADNAVNAKVLLYAPNGSVYNFVGYTMGSDPSIFGAIHEGEYVVNYVKDGKKPPLPSNWALNNKGNVPEMDYNINNSPCAKATKGTPFKDGIYIHSANASGYAGCTKFDGEGNPISGVSTGCLLLVRKDWDLFLRLMSGIKYFKLRLNRIPRQK